MYPPCTSKNVIETSRYRMNEYEKLYMIKIIVVVNNINAKGQ